MRCFFFNDTATTEIYTLSLHDALPISVDFVRKPSGPISLDIEKVRAQLLDALRAATQANFRGVDRSEEHTSELQSRQYLVCRLLLEKKKNTAITRQPGTTIDGSSLLPP